MRCGCPDCGTYMIQAESMTLGCVCPECRRRCTDCLGTNTVISREELKAMRQNPERVLSLFREQTDTPYTRPAREEDEWTD